MRTTPRPGRPALVTVLCLAATTAVLAPATLRAQEQGPRWVVEVQVRERWVHHHEQPRFVHFDERFHHYPVDSVATSGPRTTVFLRHPRRIAAAVVLERGRLASLDILSAAPATAERMGTSDTLVGARLRWIGLPPGAMLPGALHLPEPDLRDVARLWEGRSPAAGPESLATAHDGLEQRLRLHRSSRAPREVAFEGRRQLAVQDSATVDLEERVVSWSYLWGRDVVMMRSGSGSLRGHRVLDPESGVATYAADTLDLAAEVTYHQPDGTLLRTPARYQRYRAFRLLGPEAARERNVARQRAERARTTGPLITPATPRQERVAAGDVALRDSLVRVWRSTDDPDLRRQLGGDLWWARGFPLDSLAIADGDTAVLIRRLGDGISQRLSRASLDAILSWLEDPGHLLAHRLQPGFLAPDLASILAARPPAIEPDTTRWACSLETCGHLAAQRTRGRERLTRELGILAAFALDPRGWRDTVRAHATAVPGLYEWLYAYPGIGPATLPAAGSDWRQWATWVEPRLASLPDTSRLGVLGRSFRPDERHALMLRAGALLDDRPVAAELSGAYRTATLDSAKLVFGALLVVMNAWPPDSAETVRHLRAGSAPLTELAMVQARALVDRHGMTAEKTVRLAVLDDLLRMAAQGRTRSPGGSRYVRSAGIPDALIRRWRDSVAFLTEEEISALPDSVSAEVETLEVGRQHGPFVEVSRHSTAYLRRQPGEPRRRGASGSKSILMRDGDRWIVVGTHSSWIT